MSERAPPPSVMALKSDHTHLPSPSADADPDMFVPKMTKFLWGKVAWARDFCFLQHGCTTTDPDTGERLFAIVAGSIERPEVPDMENLCKRIRSKVKTSGVRGQPTDLGSSARRRVVERS